MELVKAWLPEPRLLATAIAGFYVGTQLNAYLEKPNKDRSFFERQADAAGAAAEKMAPDSADAVHEIVRAAYGARSDDDRACCGDAPTAAQTSLRLGYTEEDLELVGAANIGEGCGNPLSFANISKGDTVVDLGSGAGIDCILAARLVGDGGHVIGVDMTAGMVSRARQTIKDRNVTNVSYRLGEIEHLPIADSTVDVIMSNCVINLSPNQTQVYADAFRVLVPGGELAVADVVKVKPELPEHLKTAEALAC